jgi:hypothetical protein
VDVHPGVVDREGARALHEGSPSYEQPKVTDASLATNSNRAIRDVAGPAP